MQETLGSDSAHVSTSALYQVDTRITTIEKIKFKRLIRLCGPIEVGLEAEHPVPGTPCPRTVRMPAMRDNQRTKFRGIRLFVDKGGPEIEGPVQQHAVEAMAAESEGWLAEWKSLVHARPGTLASKVET